MKRTKILGATLLGLPLLLPARAVAQEEGGDQAKELINQIRRNMSEIETELSKIDASKSGERGRKIVDDIDKLVGGLRDRQSQILKDIDEIIKQAKLQQGSGKSDDQQQNQSQGQSGQKQKPKSRDRNEPDNRGRDRSKEQQDKNKSKEEKDKQESEKKGQSNPENNNQKPEDAGKNMNGPDKKEPDPKKAAHMNVIERWGLLPEEVRQRLVDTNFKEFTPEYEEAIKAYFLSLPKKPK